MNHSDFTHAFTPGAKLYSRSGARFEIDVVQLGMLDVPSGSIVTGDPYLLEGDLPILAREVEPDEYPVEVSVARVSGDARVACARIVFSDEPVATWELALFDGDPPDYRPAPGMLRGYGVDSGIGAFLDADFISDTAALVRETPDPISRAFQRSGHPCRCALVPLDDGNLAAFASGWGDGCYGSYWGLDADGQPVVLVTDFGLLVDPIYAVGLFDLPGEGASIAPERLARLGVSAPMRMEGGALTIEGKRDPRIELQLVDTGLQRVGRYETRSMLTKLVPPPEASRLRVRVLQGVRPLAPPVARQAPFTERKRAALVEAFRDAWLAKEKADDEGDAAALSAARLSIGGMIRDYQAALPIIPLARCPFTGELFETSIDPFGIDGMWWAYEYFFRPYVERPATFFAWTGALKLGGPIPRWSLKTMVGPEAPFVLPRILRHPDLLAVITSLRVGAHTGYPIVYFASPCPHELERVDDWGHRGHWFIRADGSPDSAHAVEDDAEKDFDLRPWLSAGKLYWIDPGDASLGLRSGREGCPYVGLSGERRRRYVQEGEDWLA